MLKFLIITVITLLAAQSFADPYGMYQGTINMSPDAAKGIPNGRKTPIVISLKQTGTEITPINPTNVFYAEKKVEGSFVLDSECGPFAFTSSEYDLETGNLVLQYGRLGNTGSPSSIVNLRIQCKRLSTGTCDGTVSSVAGQIGTISLKQTSAQVTPLPIAPKYVGAWRGIISYTPEEIDRRKVEAPGLPDPVNEQFDFNLSGGNGTVTNPDFYEIASTPLKVGGDYEGGIDLLASEVPYSSVYVDYLRGIATLTALSASSTYIGSNTLTVNFQDDGSITGTLVSARTPIGTFVAKKVQ